MYIYIYIDISFKITAQLTNIQLHTLLTSCRKNPSNVLKLDAFGLTRALLISWKNSRMKPVHEKLMKQPGCSPGMKKGVMKNRDVLKLHDGPLKKTRHDMIYSSCKIFLASLRLINKWRWNWSRPPESKIRQHHLPHDKSPPKYTGREFSQMIPSVCACVCVCCD